MLNRTLALAVIVGVFSCTSAKADELQSNILAAAKASRQDAYSFQRTMVFERTGSARKVLVERYDPRGSAAERWKLISVDGHRPNAKDVDQSRKAKRGPVPSYAELAEWFGTAATRRDGPPGYVTYQYARLPAGVLKIGSRDVSADTRAESLVSVKGGKSFVEQVRFTSNKEFRTAMVASVERIDVIRRYRLLPTGRAVPEGSVSMLTGSLLGKSGQIKTTVEFDSFQAVK